MVRGVSSDRRLEDGTLVVDIGGGSTELVTAGSETIAWAMSTEAGSVRLTERFLPPTRPPPRSSRRRRASARCSPRSTYAMRSALPAR